MYFILINIYTTNTIQTIYAAAFPQGCLSENAKLSRLIEIHPTHFVLFLGG